MNRKKHDKRLRQILTDTKERPEARKARVSSGIKYRPAVFKDKRRQEKHKTDRLRGDDEYVGFFILILFSNVL